jgi:hypothetical protein
MHSQAQCDTDCCSAFLLVPPHFFQKGFEKVIGQILILKASFNKFCLLELSFQSQNGALAQPSCAQ